MAWIQRNLLFVIGSLVAVTLLGLGGWYFYRQNARNTEAREKLNSLYAELIRYNQLKPHPGDQKVDNIKAAIEQQKQMRQLLARCLQHFERIPARPDTTNVTAEAFAAELRRTIDQLQRDATNASVQLPPRYDFSFEAIKKTITFPPGSLVPLSVQLGEVKAISDILIRAKINALDSIRRERVSTLDQGVTDYILQTSVTNDLAILSPYEVSFRCFSHDLAEVLNGFATSPHCLLVRTLNVEPAVTTPTTSPDGTPLPFPTTPLTPTYVPPTPQPQPPGAEMPGVPRRPPFGRSAEMEYIERYGIGPRRPTPPTTVTPTAPTPTPGVPAVPVRTGPQLVLNEKLLRVTLLVQVVKPKPPER